MTRTVKAPDIRRAELLEVAGGLFQSRGYAATSVDEIVRAAQVAKGTFYYYFRSKQDVLEAMVEDLVAAMAQASRAVAEDPHLDALAKLRAILTGQRRVQAGRPGVMEDLHRPENRELHDRSNVETVRVFAPIIAAVVEQGRREGVFDVEDPLSSVQFILAGSQFLFGEGVFNWTPAEAAARTRAMQAIIERALCAPAGSFGFLVEDQPGPDL
jgi:AcrR family transcriptional regulator